MAVVVHRLGKPRLGAALASMFMLVGIAAAPEFAAACEFAVVKSAIDAVLDKDEAKLKDFAKQFKEGSDPFAILDQMVPGEMAKKIDVCRFQAAEYLTKRGFPPSH